MGVDRVTLRADYFITFPLFSRPEYMQPGDNILIIATRRRCKALSPKLAGWSKVKFCRLTAEVEIDMS